MKIVSIGGGTGQSTLLEALRPRRDGGDELSAIITMSDAGGSSGVLRDHYGILPPSDLLRCAAVLSEYHPVARDLFANRIEQGDPPYHTGGNLLMAAYDREYGRRGAVDALMQMFRVRGRVLPVSYDSVHLYGRFTDQTTAYTENEIDARIQSGKEPLELWLGPDPVVNSDVATAISEADVIIIGPGSFFTSILPNMLVPGVREAINTSEAPIIFVMNLLAEGFWFGPRVHDEIVVRYYESFLELDRSIDRVLFNTSYTGVDLQRYEVEHKYPIRTRPRPHARFGWAPMWLDMPDARHNPPALAGALTLEIARLRDQK